MANAFYLPFKTAILQGQINMVSDTIKVTLVDSASYTPDMNTHDFLNDISSGARMGTSAALTNKTVVSGVFDADDIVITAVSGNQFEYIVLFKDTGNDGTSNLICLFDTASGLPYQPNSGNIFIVWDSGPNKIFKL
jgi:hypothetical protein